MIIIHSFSSQAYVDFTSDRLATQPTGTRVEYQAVSERSFWSDPVSCYRARIRHHKVTHDWTWKQRDRAELAGWSRHFKNVAGLLLAANGHQQVLWMTVSQSLVFLLNLHLYYQLSSLNYRQRYDASIMDPWIRITGPMLLYRPAGIKKHLV